jgi:hypothetical protein
MIITEEGLKETQYWVAEIERMLNDLRKRVQPISEQKFRIMASGCISQIRKMRAEIDEYIGITAYNNFVPPKTSEPVPETRHESQVAVLV